MTRCPSYHQFEIFATNTFYLFVTFYWYCLVGLLLFKKHFEPIFLNAFWCKDKNSLLTHNNLSGMRGQFPFTLHTLRSSKESYIFMLPIHR
jgi:hypothetical protein